VLDYYNALIARMTSEYEIRQGASLTGEGGTTRSGSQAIVTRRVELIGSDGPQRVFPVGSRLRVRIRGEAREAVASFTVGIAIRDRLGVEAFGTNTHHLGVASPSLDPGEAFCAEIELPLNLAVGSYALTVALHAGAVHVEGNYDWWDEVVSFQVMPGGEPVFVGSAYLPSSARFTSGAAATEQQQT
jgi:lipopolysaccharide transport system ATP-binding protein